MLRMAENVSPLDAFLTVVWTLDHSQNRTPAAKGLGVRLGSTAASQAEHALTKPVPPSPTLQVFTCT